jgi:hypothetical protein
MLLNLGSVGGPTDGTSTLARKVDATVGPGKPGLVFVTGTSDDGGATNRASGTVAQDQTVTLDIQKESTGPLTFDFVVSGNRPLSCACPHANRRLWPVSGTRRPERIDHAING